MYKKDIDSHSLSNVILEIKKYFTAKVIIAALTAGFAIPYTKLLYWTFDTAYLSGFGVSPEIYSREIFSSGFVSVWLFSVSMAPLMFVWSLICLIAFVLLTAVSVEAESEDQVFSFTKRTRVALDKNSRYVKLMRKLSCKAIKGFRSFRRSQFVRGISHYLKSKSIYRRLVISASKSFNIPAFVYVIGLVVLLIVLFSFSFASREGRQLANGQLVDYRNKALCNDGFNSTNIGCFSIKGIKGDNHFVISNSDSHLIYLSGDEAKQNAQEETPQKLMNIELTILEKKHDIPYEIKRTFQSTSQP